MCAEASENALKLYNRWDSLPSIARHATLSTTNYTNYGCESLLRKLRKYRNRCVSGLRSKIENVIDSVEWMTNGGDTQFYTFAFSNGGRKIEFIGFAIRKKCNGLFDFSKYTYSFDKEDHEIEKLLAKMGISTLFGIIFPPLGLGMALFSLLNTADEASKPISNSTKDVLEACFIYELVKRGAAKVRNGRLLLVNK